MRRTLLPALAAAAALVLSSCSGGSSSPDDTRVFLPDEPAGADPDTSVSDEANLACKSGQPVAGSTLKVVTTVAPLTSLAGLLASGTPIEVEGLVPEGTDPHGWVLPASAAAVIAGADVIIANGLGLDDAVVGLAQETMKDTAVLCRVGDAAVLRSEWAWDESYPEEEEVPNPHAWLNPPYVLTYVTLMRDAMTNALPSAIPVVDENYVKLSALATELDSAMKTAVETVPVRTRAVLATHDALPYLARHFGLTIAGSVLPLGAEAADVEGLVAQVKDEKIPAVFSSALREAPVAEIATRSGARNGGTLHDDDLPGDPGDAEHSWGGLLRHDLITLVTALGGDASALEKVNLSLGITDGARYPG